MYKKREMLEHFPHVVHSLTSKPIHFERKRFYYLYYQTLKV